MKYFRLTYRHLKEKEMQKEYKVFDPGTIAEFEKILNEWPATGWKIHTIDLQSLRIVLCRDKS